MNANVYEQLPLRTSSLREDQVRLGLWIFLATVTMLFAAFTSAYIVRRSSSDWHRVVLPSILWLNTAVLGASSIALEMASRYGAANRRRLSLVNFSGAIMLGVAFLGGQFVAWRQMVAAGVYLPTNPHSSFFFMLTGAHGLHIVAALAVLAWGANRTWYGRLDPKGLAASMEVCRTFWHFLGAIWLFLFGMLAGY